MPFRPYRTSSIRASDADRESVVGYLKQEYAQGRLSREELSQRAESAYAAITVAELEALIRDLPGSPLEPPSPAAPSRTPLKAVATLALLAVLAVAVLHAVPAQLWAPLLVLALPLGAMLLFTILPVVLPLAAGAWLLRRVERAPVIGPGDSPFTHARSYEWAAPGAWRIVSVGRPSDFFRR